MTAEIAVMNKEAVALAADSAVTSFSSGGKKIFTTADKIFALSDTSPVGIMFYNSATFMGVPWDTILKTFRTQLPKKGYDKLEDYVSAFIEFLEKENKIITVKMQKEFLWNIAMGYFGAIREEIEEVIKITIKEHGTIDNKTVEDVVLKVINEHADKWKDTKGVKRGSIRKNTGKKIVVNNKAIIENAIGVAFDKIPISKVRNRLFEIIESLLYIGTNENLSSGIVIAGFGEKEAFPTLVHMETLGLFDNKLKRSPISKSTISTDTGAIVSAFAQCEMVVRFMQGIDPLYEEMMAGYLSQLPEMFANHLIRRLSKYNKSEKEYLKNKLIIGCNKIIGNFHKNMVKERGEKFVEPITNIVAVLPKSDLASLAESLVSLTVVKRKFSAESESVAEPVDVALISKGDGFIWIKRKHYFQPNLNPAFMARRYKE